MRPAAARTEVLFQSGGHQLWAEYLAAPIPADNSFTVVLSHGLTNSHVDAPVFAEFTSLLLDAGCDVFTFDYYGSGRSAGRFEDKTFSLLRRNLADAITIAERTARTGDQSIALFGRSVGGTLAAFHSRHPAVFAAVLGSAPLHLKETFDPTNRGVSPDGFVYLDRRFRPSGQLRGEYRLRPEFYNELPQLEHDLVTAVAGSQHVLVVQGGSDYKVSADEAHYLYGRLHDPKDLVVIPGMDHDYVGHETEVAALSLRWMLTMREQEPGG